MYVLWHWAFDGGPYFGVTFLIAAILATLFIRPLGEDAWQAFRRGDTLTAAALAGLVIVAWLSKRQLETGRMRAINVGVFRRKRRPRRR